MLFDVKSLFMSKVCSRQKFVHVKGVLDPESRGTNYLQFLPDLPTGLRSDAFSSLVELASHRRLVAFSYWVF
jgi:hypothetical protein